MILKNITHKFIIKQFLSFTFKRYHDDVQSEFFKFEFVFQI
jgi:hypothetical protein